MLLEALAHVLICFRPREHVDGPKRIACFNSGLQILGAGLMLMFGTSGSPASTYEPSSIMPPKPLRETRGVWIPSIGNLCWPSQKGLSTAEQKAELVALLDRATELKLNTVFLQVRPSCDALYSSRIEPWSEYLTGTMGKAPLPFYDPLAFAVQEAHKRGLELHAWFNPYRARNSPVPWPVAANHVIKAHPSWVLRYGSQLWLDPSEKDVQDYVLKVISDVVRRYDIDGIQFDDYFYPYPEKDRSGKILDFPDSANWNRAEVKGRLTRDDWRRENVNTLVRRVYESIKAAKPYVKFGISPFGIWRPGEPPQISGFDAFAQLNADSKKWLGSGWIDYLAPQLYWAIDSPQQSFPVLLKWWADQNIKSRNVYAGLDATKTNQKWNVQEILNQIRLTRQQNGIGGHIHWNMRALMNNSSLVAALEREVYQQPALPAASPWLNSSRPAKPKLRTSRLGSINELPRHGTAKAGSQLKATWEKDETTWLWLLQIQNGKEWKTEVLPAPTNSRVWAGRLPDVIAVTAIDRYGMAGPSAVVQRAR
jgi:uncharacterized lipoprotein YddW (UPF0748 family)